MKAFTKGGRKKMNILSRITKIISKIFIYAVQLFVILISVGPVIWVVVSSVKTNGDILSGPFGLPEKLNFSAYQYLFQEFDFMRYFTNSVIVSLVPTLLSLIMFAMAAYVIAKYDFPGKNLFYTLLVITLLVPGHARTQPIFSLIFKLGLYDTKTALILVYLSGGMAVSMFILRSGFMSVPMELSEAAKIDGAGFFRTFWTINLPLAKNSMVTAGILMFLGNWNEFYYANLLTSSMENKTLPIITTMFITQFSFDYTKTFAALTLLIIPGIIAYAFTQDKVQQSVASSGIKG